VDGIDQEAEKPEGCMTIGVSSKEGKSAGEEGKHLPVPGFILSCVSFVEQGINKVDKATVAGALGEGN